MHRWDPLLHPLRSSNSSSRTSKSKSTSKHHPNPHAKPPAHSSMKSRAPSTGSAYNRESKHVHFAEDYTPSLLKLKIMCGPRHDPSLIIYVKLKFEVGGRPRLGFKIRHPREEREERIDKAERADFEERLRYGRQRPPMAPREEMRERSVVADGESSTEDGSVESRYGPRTSEKDHGRDREARRARAKYSTEERWPGKEGRSKKSVAPEEHPKATTADEEDAEGIEERARRRY